MIKGRSDQAGCSAIHVSAAVRSALNNASSATRTAPAPDFSSATNAPRLLQACAASPPLRSRSTDAEASRPIGARTSTRKAVLSAADIFAFVQQGRAVAGIARRAGEHAAEPGERRSHFD